MRVADLQLTESIHSGAVVPVRDDLLANYQRIWHHVGAPGTWWTGRERVAIAAEVRRARDCALCAERKAALSPYAVPGEHEAADLPVAAVEMVHRITTDNQRLSRRFHDDAIAGGLTQEQFVETLGVTINVISADVFCLALSIPLPPLPEAQPGEPSRHRPVGPFTTEAWVPMLGQPSGPDADLWEGFVPNVMRAMSLVPDEVRNLRARIAPEFVANEHDLLAARSLTRPQMEFISARVSALNECFY